MTLVLKAISGGFCSNHLSIYPHKTVGNQPPTPTSSNGSSVNLLSVDGKMSYRVPSNIGYYFSSRLKPKYRWSPPKDLLDMLMGKVDIVITSSNEVHTNPKTTSLGWIDYAHPDGTVYSGVDSGFYADVSPFKTSFNDTLIECEDHSNPTKANNCEEFSYEYLEGLDILSHRARFLTKFAVLLEHFGLDDTLKYIKENLDQAAECYGGVDNLIREIHTNPANNELKTIKFKDMTWQIPKYGITQELKIARYPGQVMAD
tara:strand:- start:1056 stop:1829 length:774 start_codon:yes stop_codon:yes gene_type:complete